MSETTPVSHAMEGMIMDMISKSITAFAAALAQLLFIGVIFGG